MNEDATLRLFVAVMIPDTVREAIAKAQSELRKLIPNAAISWTRPEQFHLTLKFLGTVRAEDVDPLCIALQSVCGAFKPLALKSSGAGFFPSPSRPRVLWAGLEESTAQLPGLHAATESAVAEFTGEKPENRFHAHVTLGRLKQAQRSDVEAIRRWAELQSARVYGCWEADSLALVQSRLSPKGAVYSLLASFPLSR